MPSPLFSHPEQTTWNGASGLGALTYACGYCGDKVSSSSGFLVQVGPAVAGHIRICPACKCPTTFVANRRFPGVAPGQLVPNLPAPLEQTFSEARQSASAGAFTASVLICRKLLMNVAVQEGAPEGGTFISYVEYLADKGYVPPKGKVWVDYIRKRGNEATHEIALMTEEDAVALIRFAEMLLRFIYEFPELVPPSTPK